MCCVPHIFRSQAVGGVAADTSVRQMPTWKVAWHALWLRVEIF